MILYMTSKDADILRRWLNDEPRIAWIVEVGRDGDRRTWKAVSTRETIEARDHCLWHRDSGPLNVPSGSIDVADAIVLDPAEGWTQVLVNRDATTPWFGANLPGPYVLSFRERGRESSGSLARSDFGWHGDRFRSIGKPAHPLASRWWSRVQRFIKGQAAAIPWPYPDGPPHSRAYAFPDAHAQILEGRPVDVNP